jgi:dUTP pyrophosphatase
MHLSIFIDDNNANNGELKNRYFNAALNHNAKLFKDPHFYDAGFDLFLPRGDNDNDYDGTRFFGNDGEKSSTTINKINFKVKCCAKMFFKSGTNINNNVNNNLNNDLNNNFFYTPFYTYARSSMSKTPLRLANNQGIIDAGYRGNLISMFDVVHNGGEDYWGNKYDRYIQICAPSLMPVVVEVVNSVAELGDDTSRGDGAFGSTGK